MFVAPEDYEANVSSHITFSPAQTSASLTIIIVDDDILEDVEQFTVEVVATGGQERVDIGDGATIFIPNDDCEKVSIFTSSIIACLPSLSYSCDCWLRLHNILCLRS